MERFHVQDFAPAAMPVDRIGGVSIFGLAEETASELVNLGVSDQFLGNAAEYIAKYTNPSHFIDIYRRALTQVTLPNSTDEIRVLDIGVGGGNSAFALFHLIERATVLGVDISLPLLRICAQAAPGFGIEDDRLTLLRADLAQLTPAPGTVDLVTGASILHHLLDPAQIIETALPALRPGGVAIFFEPFEDGHGILRGIYAAILEAEPRHKTAVPDALRQHMTAYIRDFDARKGIGTVREHTRFLDDKWMFTKSWFETLGKRCGCRQVRFIPTHSHQQIFWRQFVVQARLDNGSDAAGLPDWGKQIFAAFDDSFSTAQLAELCFTGIIVMER